MNKKTFGDIISEARKCKNISQEDLAKKLNVSRQTISRWENNKAMPDVTILNELCQYLEIDKETLQNKDIMEIFKVNELLLNEKVKLKKRNRIIILFLSVIFFLIAILLVAIFNHNSFSVYKISIIDDNIKLNNGIFIYSKYKEYFQLGEISTDFLENKDNIFSLKIYQKRDYGEALIIEREYSENFIISEDYGYNEYFDEDFLKYLDSTYIDIKYLDKTWKNYSYKLEFELNFKSSKLFYFPKSRIVPKSIAKEQDDGEDLLSITDKLIKNGYTYNNAENKFENDLKNFNYIIDSNALWYADNLGNTSRSIRYNIKDNEVLSDAYDSKNNKYLYDFIYNIENEKLYCVVGNCKDYLDTIDIVINEYNKLIN